MELEPGLPFQSEPLQVITGRWKITAENAPCSATLETNSWWREYSMEARSLATTLVLQFTGPGQAAAPVSQAEILKVSFRFAGHSHCPPAAGAGAGAGLSARASLRGCA